MGGASSQTSSRATTRSNSSGWGSPSYRSPGSSPPTTPSPSPVKAKGPGTVVREISGYPVSFDIPKRRQRAGLSVRKRAARVPELPLPLSESEPEPEPEPEPKPEAKRGTGTMVSRAKPASEETKDPLAAIQQRRNSFFVAKRETILPLLPEKNLIRTLVDSREYESAQTQPYSAVDRPTKLRAELKPYQLDGLSFLVYLQNNGIGGILGDEMGLGKTVQTLALLQFMKEKEGPQAAPSLVICPLSVLETWISEARNWTPGLKLVKYHGPAGDRAKVKALVASGKKANTVTDYVDVLITSYDTLISDIVWFRRVFVWKYVVLDEGHHIKNPEAKRTKMLNQLKTEFKLVLTGTPIQNNLAELWSIFHWLYPAVFDQSSAALFKDAFSLSEGRVDRDFLDGAKRFLELIMLRRVKDSVDVGVKIPEKTEITLSVPLSKYQHSWYLRILKGCDQLLGETGSSARQMYLAGVESPVEQRTQLSGGQRNTYRVLRNTLMELRKCSIHPYLLDEAFPDPYVVGAHVMRNSGKFIILEKMLRQFVLAEGQKVIIFSGFDQALNLCEDVLTHVRGNARGFEYARIDGSTLSAWRNLAIYLFNNDLRYKVFLVSIRAGGEGLNLASASRVVFLDEDWNPQVMRQAEARAHRLGQTKPVTIFKIHSRGTVEEQMVGRLAKKAYLGAKLTENMQTPNSLDELTDMAELKEASNSSNGSAAVIVNFVESLMRQKRLSDNQIDTNTLLSWDWATILENCADVQSGERDIAESITEEDEQAWLERRERIKTNVFNGAKVEKTTTSWRHPVADNNPELARAERRVGKQRIVLVDGYEVTKGNLSLSEETSSSPASASSAKPKERIVHYPRCFLCHQNGGDECQECPRSFHRHCLETEPLNASPYKERYGFMCPHHYCAGCRKTASQAGQLLYCCRSCTRAYCEQCLDWSNTVFIGTDVYEAAGYVPKSAFYTECAACRTRPKRKDPFGGGFSKRTRWGS